MLLIIESDDPMIESEVTHVGSVKLSAGTVRLEAISIKASVPLVVRDWEDTRGEAK